MHDHHALCRLLPFSQTIELLLPRNAHALLDYALHTLLDYALLLLPAIDVSGAHRA
jgi:hypothetical protein